MLAGFVGTRPLAACTPKRGMRKTSSRCLLGKPSQYYYYPAHTRPGCLISRMQREHVYASCSLRIAKKCVNAYRAHLAMPYAATSPSSGLSAMRACMAYCCCRRSCASATTSLRAHAQGEHYTPVSPACLCGGVLTHRMAPAPVCVTLARAAWSPESVIHQLANCLACARPPVRKLHGYVASLNPIRTSSRRRPVPWCA